MTTPPPPQMPVLSAGGFSVYVDTFAYDELSGPGAPDVAFYFLSLLGPAQSTRAIWARLLKEELVTLAWDDARLTRFGRLASLGPKGWRMYSAGLPTAAGHQLVLVPSLALANAVGEEFVTLPRDEAEAPALHYQFLNRRLELPLHPNWSAWLWTRARDSGEARPLVARGLHAYRCRPDPAALARDVGRAIRQHRLTLPLSDAGSACRAA